MKLYYMPGVCSQAVHIALAEIGSAYDIDKVDGETKTTASGENFKDVNPLGYVPALKTDAGDVLLEAPAILQFLADQNPGANLAPANGTMERVRLQEELNFIASELHKSFGPFFAPIKPEGALKDQTLNKLRSRFDQVELKLADGRAFLLGETFSVADAYAFVVASWSGLIGLDISDWPKTAAYVERIRARSAVQDVLKAEGLLN